MLIFSLRKRRRTRSGGQRRAASYSLPAFFLVTLLLEVSHSSLRCHAFHPGTPRVGAVVVFAGSILSARKRQQGRGLEGLTFRVLPPWRLPRLGVPRVLLPPPGDRTGYDPAEPQRVGPSLHRHHPDQRRSFFAADCVVRGRGPRQICLFHLSAVRHFVLDHPGVPAAHHCGSGPERGLGRLEGAWVLVLLFLRGRRPARSGVLLYFGRPAEERKEDCAGAAGDPRGEQVPGRLRGQLPERVLRGVRRRPAPPANRRLRQRPRRMLQRERPAIFNGFVVVGSGEPHPQPESKSERERCRDGVKTIQNDAVRELPSPAIRSVTIISQAIVVPPRRLLQRLGK